jgi:hypothetical protein
MSRRPHPSGRPIRRFHVVGKQLYRIPREEYETPRLNQRSPTHAIGFVVDHLPGHQDYENED